jgi:ribosomal protein L44E
MNRKTEILLIIMTRGSRSYDRNTSICCRCHPECAGMPFEEVMKLHDFRFVCSECSSKALTRQDMNKDSYIIRGTNKLIRGNTSKPFSPSTYQVT